MNIFGREPKNFVLSVKNYSLHDGVLHPRECRACGTLNPKASAPVVAYSNRRVGGPWRVSQVSGRRRRDSLSAYC